MAPSRGGAAAAALLLLALALGSSCTCAEAGSGSKGKKREPEKDPWPELLAKAQSVRPSAVYPYSDVQFPRLELAIPCLGRRLCECAVAGNGFNRTFWLNMAAAVFQGDVYVGILHRTVVHKTSVSYEQAPNEPPLHAQVFEVNSVLLCKMDNITGASPRLRDCHLVEPGPGYREKHPAGHNKHFELVGMIDPRLISAGDESGLFLQVGRGGAPAHAAPGG